MLKKKNSKFSFPLVASVALHIGLIAVLGYSAWQHSSPYSGQVKGESIDAIMVDTQIMTEHYQRQLQQQLSSQQVKQQQQTQIEKQARELKEQQLAEQKRLKEIEKERLLALEKQKKETDSAALALAKLAEQKKQALIDKQKDDDAAKIRAQKELEDKKRIESERQQAEQAKQKAVAEAEQAKKEAEKLKQLAEQEKQKALQEAQSKQELNDLLGGLTSNVPAAQQGVSTAELNQYKSLVHGAISNKFINPKLYSGKNCVLKIQLAPDGYLLNVTAQDGDPILCREAISATKLAKFPKPKNDILYQQVKNLTIDFSPK